MNEVVLLALEKGQKLHKLYEFALAALDSYRRPNITVTIGGSVLANSTDAVLSTEADLNPALSEYYPRAATYELKKLIQYFHTSRKLPTSKLYNMAANTLFDSLYFPCIFVWDYIFDSNNIYVIEVERLSLNDMNHSDGRISETYVEYTDTYSNRSIREEFSDIFK